MKSVILPTTAELRAALESLTRAQITQIAEISDIPFTSIMNIRSGVSKNPGIETVSRFLPALKLVLSALPASAP